MKHIAAFVLAILGTGASTTLLAQVPIAQGPRSGSIPRGVVVTTDSFPFAPVASMERVAGRNYEVELPHPPPPKKVVLPTGPEGSNYYEDMGARSTAATISRPIVLHNFAGLPDENRPPPPDPIVAVGPNHIMGVVNTRFRIWDKAGTVLKTVQARDWFASALPGWQGWIFDPKIKYDHYANRWIFLFVSDDGDSATPGDISYYLISVSDDENPLGIWYNWAIPASTVGDSVLAQWTDYPGLGFDDQAVYIESNQAFRTVTMLYCKIRILNKAQLYANTAGPISWTDFWDLRDPDNTGTKEFDVLPAVSFGSPGAGLLVGASPYNPGTFITLWRITNPSTNPTISAQNIPVVQYREAPNAGQPGGGPSIDHGDGYLLPNEPVYRDSSLWVVHSIASGTGNTFSSLRYIRLNPFTNTVREDIAFGREGSWYFFPAAMVDQDKNLVLTFSRSSTTEYVGAYISGRRDTDSMGLAPSVAIKYGETNYVRLDAFGRNRWGDFMGIALDPSDGHAVWAFTEYAASPANTWGTWIGKVKMGPIPGAYISLDRSSISYGRSELDTHSDTVTVTLMNIGLDTLIVSNISLSTPHFSIVDPPPLPLRLATHETEPLGVSFTPRSPGDLADSIMISSNDMLSPSATIALSGRGVLIGQAEAGVMYATSDNPSQLYTMSPATGAASPVGPTGATRIDGLAIHPSSKELYGILAGSANSTLYRLSRHSGDALFARDIPIPSLRAIAFSLNGDTLYAGTGTGRLYGINVTSGETIYIGTSGKVYSGFAISPTSNRLWASVRPTLSGRDSIYIVNRTTGTATGVGRTLLNVITPDLAFNERGNLFALIGTGTQTNTLYSLDTLTATATLIGSTNVSGLLTIALRTDSAGTVGVAERMVSSIPTTYGLAQSYPNPCNPTATIDYQIPTASHVTMKVYDVLGREVATLVNGAEAPGYRSVRFDASILPSGVYFYRLFAGDFVATKKLVLVK